jgi:hypothetical protein
VFPPIPVTGMAAGYKEEKLTMLFIFPQIINDIGDVTVLG